MEKEITINNQNSVIQKRPYHKRKKIKFPKHTNAFSWLVIFILFCVGVYTLRSVLLPFVAGIVLGYLFDPLASRFEKWGMSRTVATILVFVAVVAWLNT